MINAAELRTGNFISYKGQLLTVKGVGNYGYVTTEEGVDGYVNEFTPIALTPAILAVCGFMPFGAGNRIMVNDGDLFINLNDGDVFLSEDDAPGKFDVRLSFYLHRLQNLYYELTNQELQVQIDELKKALK